MIMIRSSPFLQPTAPIIRATKLRKNSSSPRSMTGSSSPANSEASSSEAGSSGLTSELEEDTCRVSIRRVSERDLRQIVNLFQAFDTDKYEHISNGKLGSTSPDNNNGRKGPTLAALRIDDMGGIYLTPVLDQTNAYFKCYVAEDVTRNELIGYILFFNTLGSNTANHSNKVGRPGRHQNSPLGDEIVAVVEDLFVKDDYRGRGVATQLLRKVVKSSMDRGCYSCECLLIPDSPGCLGFWRRRVGAARVNRLVKDSGSEGSTRPHEVFLELSRAEMKTFHEKMEI